MEIQQPGATVFTQLSDVPQTYSGAGSKTVSVNVGATGLTFTAAGGGSGTVTDFIFTNANGISGSVLTSTVTPTLTLSLGAITPTSVAASGTVTGSNLSGTNTGDQTGGTPAITLGTANAAGASPNFLRRDDTILAFDATSPTTQAFGDAAVVGVATVAARRDHKHAMMDAPTTVSGNAGTATALQNARTIGTTTGDATSAGSSFDGTANNTNALTVVKINGTLMSGLATGILKNTTGTGVPSIAINSDLPVMSATVGGAVPTPPNNTTTFLRGDGTFATVTATQPDLPQVLMAPAVDETITAGYSVMMGMRYTIASAKRLTIGLSGRMRVI